MARVAQIALLEDAFDVVAEAMGEGLKFGNASTNWSNTNATNHTAIVLQLEIDETLQYGGVAPGKAQQVVIKKSALSNVAPAQESTYVRLRDTTFRVHAVNETDALFVIDVVDPND